MRSSKDIKIVLAANDSTSSSVSEINPLARSDGFLLLKHSSLPATTRKLKRSYSAQHLLPDSQAEFIEAAFSNESFRFLKEQKNKESKSTASTIYTFYSEAMGRKGGGAPSTASTEFLPVSLEASEDLCHPQPLNRSMPLARSFSFSSSPPIFHRSKSDSILTSHSDQNEEMKPTKKSSGLS